MAEAGDRFGPFALGELLVDEGAFQHWRAVRDDGTRRAPREVEIRLSTRPSDEVALAALRAEYNTLRILSDARIVRPLSFYAEQAGMALEYHDCLTLEELVEAARRRLVVVDVPTAVDVVLEVAHALRHVHSIVRSSERLVHGALTARQVALNRDGDVLVAGVGRPHRHLADPWRPPEDERGEPRTAATDVWHLGVLGVLLATASRSTSSLDLAPRLQLLGREHPALAQVLGRCLQGEPAYRYPHDGELIRELYGVFSALDAPSRRRAIAAELLHEQPASPAEAPPLPDLPPVEEAPERAPDDPDVEDPAGIWTRTGAESTDPGIGVRRDPRGQVRARAIDDEPDTDPSSPFRESAVDVIEREPSYSPRATDDDIWVDTPPDAEPDPPRSPRREPEPIRATFEPRRPPTAAVAHLEGPPNPSGLPRYEPEPEPELEPAGTLAGLPVAHWVAAITMTVLMTVVMLILLEDVL